MSSLTPTRLVLRSLLHHWRIHAAVGLGVAVACAILTGSLLVGDSVQATLEELARERRGQFEAVLTSERFFRSELEGEDETPGTAPGPLVAILMVDGSVAARREGTLLERATGVSIVGVTERFFETGFPQFPGDSSALTGDGARLNRSLAEELGVVVGDSITLELRTSEEAPLESFLGADPEGGTRLGLTVREILPDRGPGLFSLRGTQAAPRIVYLDRARLGEALGREGRASVLLAPAGRAGQELDQLLAGSLTPDDLGFTLRLRDDLGLVSLESRRMVLAPAVQEFVEKLAAEKGWRFQGALTHLARSISVEGSTSGGPAGRGPIPYSMITAMPVEDAPPLGPLPSAPPTLAEDEILLGAWAAADLGLDGEAIGSEKIRVEYYLPESTGAARTQAATFTLAGIIPLEGLAARSDLTPEYPGLTTAEVENLRDWDPPFEVDLSVLRDQDEEYWKEHRATPKAFVSPEAGRKHFRGSHGEFTTIHLAPAGGESLEDLHEELERALTRPGGLPRELGVIWRDLAGTGEGSTEASTDFGGLFISFSFFLIISTTILIALLFILGVERRHREAGLLLAVGHETRQVRRLLVREGLVVALVGGVLGLGLALAYGKFLLQALSTWWWGAVRVPYFVFEVEPLSLAIGLFATLVIVWLAIHLASRSLERSSIRQLLARGSRTGVSRRGGGGRGSARVGLVSAILALALAGYSLTRETPDVAAFFGTGALGLVAGLAGLSWLLRRRPARSETDVGVPGLFRVGARNSSRAPTRSLLTSGLIASAAFILVAVAANQHDSTADSVELRSGNGGFHLLATSRAPLPGSFSSPAVRERLGLEEYFLDLPDGSQEEVDWSGVEAHAFRVKPGDDTSCLNLYQPRNPRVLGAPEGFIERGGFVFKGALTETPEEEANPWELLRRAPEDGVLPAIGDWNSMTWILKKGLGDIIEVDDGRGGQVRLRLVATLSGSLFQGELLVSEAAFREAFPAIEGAEFFLVELDEKAVERSSRLSLALEQGLSSFGVDVMSPNRLIASYLAIENTYLSTFQFLGGLGLILGTLGLGIVLVRGVLERRSEFALLAAVGFSRSRLAALVLAENLFLLTGGLVIGSVSALVAVAPRLVDPAARIPAVHLAGLLALVFLAGLLSGVLAVAAVVRTRVLEALRSE